MLCNLQGISPQLVQSYMNCNYSACFSLSLIFILFLCIQFFLAKLINKFRWKAMLITDSRVRTMNEILNSIKLIKMYAWEDSFEKKIAGMKSSFFSCVTYCNRKWTWIFIQHLSDPPTTQSAFTTLHPQSRAVQIYKCCLRAVAHKLPRTAVCFISDYFCLLFVEVPLLVPQSPSYVCL